MYEEIKEAPEETGSEEKEIEVPATDTPDILDPITDPETDE